VSVLTQKQLDSLASDLNLDHISRDAEELASAAFALGAAQEREECAKVLREAREALQFSNDTPNGAITDTIWMMHRPETLFDFMDAAIRARSKA
jgi:hypothetical protein